MDTSLTNPLGTQAALFAALARFTEAHPDLPGAYITASDITPAEAHVLLDGPSDLEAWRHALHAEPADVLITERDEGTKLLFTASLGRIALRVYTIFAPAAVAVSA
ncbi:hypothetical protein OTC26_005825 [Streptomyces tirandamycinicus]|uniref:hypothetical protein n=1 Tax=Streptomyces tirandamycinicus TaxID=2174846 RepID=UPI00226E61D1|nr:hypothetical protein [Streptomyces tirandamycinicus]MCY0984329.1 hypothetical protein [Streptomyces tirandamycinicus]